MSKISLIIEREYLTRVQKKSFILMTILSPIIMVLLCTVPILLSQMSDNETRHVAIVDYTGLYKDVFDDNEEYHFHYLESEAAANPDILKKDEEGNGNYAYIVIKSDLLLHPDGMTIYSDKQVTTGFESFIENRMSDYLEDAKLASYNIPDIKKIIEDSKIKLQIQSIRLDEEGGETQSSSGMAMGIGMISTLIIYIFLLLYGGQVMNSVMQEKTNRIVEVMVSSVKPFELMMGKIISIGLVGLTQIAIWVIFIAGIAFSATAILGLSSDVDTAAMVQTINEANSIGMPEAATAATPDIMAEITGMLGGVNFTELLFCFILFFIGGYVLYASIFAAIGSAVDNEADTQQFMIPITFIIIFAFYAGFFSAENPDGPLAWWCSMIPFTSPIVMMVRLPFGVPVWELILSIGILFGSAVGLTWVAGRIYRVGILMYGKKPSYKEMLKWIRYNS